MITITKCFLFKWKFSTIFICTFAFLSLSVKADDMEGRVEGLGNPISGSTVTLYAAGSGSPRKLAQGKTDEKGYFKFHVDRIFQAPTDAVLYLVAKGGTPGAATAKGSNDAISFMLVLGTSLQRKVTINEFTTIASVYSGTLFANKR